MVHLLLVPPSLIREMSFSEIDKQIIKSVGPTSKLMFPSCRVVHSRCWATRALVRKGNDHRTRIYQNTGGGRVTSDTRNNIKEGRTTSTCGRYVCLAARDTSRRKPGGSQWGSVSSSRFGNEQIGVFNAHLFLHLQTQQKTSSPISVQCAVWWG